MSARGKRAGVRPSRHFPRRALALAGGGIIALALWIYLVWSAIHFGSRARGGTRHDWWLAIAMTIGAVAALFVCLMLLIQASRTIGLIATPEPRKQRAAPTTPKAARVKGGKRAAR